MKSLKVFCFIALFCNCWKAIEAQMPLIQWQGAYGGTAKEGGYSVIVKNDSAITITGYAESSNGNVSNHHSPGLIIEDVWVIQLNSLGHVIWNKCFGGTSIDVGHSIKLTYDNGYVFCGWTASNDGDVSG